MKNLLLMTMLGFSVFIQAGDKGSQPKRKRTPTNFFVPGPSTAKRVQNNKNEGDKAVPKKSRPTTATPDAQQQRGNHNYSVRLVDNTRVSIKGFSPVALVIHQASRQLPDKTATTIEIGTLLIPFPTQKGANWVKETISKLNFSPSNIKKTN